MKFKQFNKNDKRAIENEEELYNSLVQRINISMLDVNRIFINFKHEIEIGYEKLEKSIELTNNLIETGQYSYAKAQIDYLNELINVYKKHYENFMEAEKKFEEKVEEKIVESYNMNLDDFYYEVK
jgi:soluble cytochrome b562